MTDPLALAMEMLAGLEGVAPGPWQVLTEKYPWILPAKPEWDQPEEKRGFHIERRIATIAHHPQSHSPMCITGQATGIGNGDVLSYTFVAIDEADADHLARCSPDRIRALAESVISLTEENERLREAARHLVEKEERKEPGHYDRDGYCDNPRRGY